MTFFEASKASIQDSIIIAPDNSYGETLEQENLAVGYLACK